MSKRYASKAVQAGFTLVELIIVIVVMGILAAVAIPKFSNSQQGAYEASQKATLASMKAAWAIYYSANKAAPTITQLATQMDPACTPGENTITCPGVKKKDGTADLAFTVTVTSGVVAAPDAITIPQSN